MDAELGGHGSPEAQPALEFPRRPSTERADVKTDEQPAREDLSEAGRRPRAWHRPLLEAPQGTSKVRPLGRQTVGHEPTARALG